MAISSTLAGLQNPFDTVDDRAYSSSIGDAVGGISPRSSGSQAAADPELHSRPLAGSVAKLHHRLPRGRHKFKTPSQDKAAVREFIAKAERIEQMTFGEMFSLIKSVPIEELNRVLARAQA